MAINVNTTTNNPIVDAISKINFTGNIIPEAWHQTIVDENGKSQPNQVLILADIVYWYTATITRDEVTQDVTYSKKFKDDKYLQRSYDQLSQKFNISKRQATACIQGLEKLGVIKRHFRTISNGNVRISNVMFLELIPKKLLELTFPTNDNMAQNNTSATPITKNCDTPQQEEFDLSQKNATPVTEKCETNTKNTTEITTKNTTTTDVDVVHAIEKEYLDLNITKDEVVLIAKSSNYDIDKCIRAKELLLSQRNKIDNIVGWLIKAVKEDFHATEQQPKQTANMFNQHMQSFTSDDIQEIEQLILQGKW